MLDHVRHVHARVRGKELASLPGVVGLSPEVELYGQVGGDLVRKPPQRHRWKRPRQHPACAPCRHHSVRHWCRLARSLSRRLKDTSGHRPTGNEWPGAHRPRQVLSRCSLFFEHETPRVQACMRPSGACLTMAVTVSTSPVEVSRRRLCCRRRPLVAARMPHRAGAARPQDDGWPHSRRSSRIHGQSGTRRPHLHLDSDLVALVSVGVLEIGHVHLRQRC